LSPEDWGKLLEPRRVQSEDKAYFHNKKRKPMRRVQQKAMAPITVSTGKTGTTTEQIVISAKKAFFMGNP
jgi:hypothetical protein